MPYTLAYKDRFIRGFSPITGDACANSIPFPYYPQNEPSLIKYEWTGEQITRLFSALKTGADLMFPDVANDILWDFLKGLSCPPTLDPEGSCIEYLPSSPFLSYYPDSPYIEGDQQTGWYRDAWFPWSEFFNIFPTWIADWLPGFAGSLTQYQNSDVLCNIASLAYVSWQAFLNDGGIFPKIEIRFSGTGTVGINLLSFPLGGKAVVELDGEPNVLDILTSGVFDPAAFAVELDRDLISFPPDEYPVVRVDVPVETPGDHILYIVFIPVVNDETTFLKFGGGLRSIELCGFADAGGGMVDNIVWDGCALKKVVDGVTTTIVTAEQMQACMDIPSGGGGGGASIVAKTVSMRLATSTFTTTSTTAVVVQGVFYTPTKSNMMLIAKSITALHSSASGHAGVQVRFGGSNGVNWKEGAVQGTSGRQASANAVFAVTPGVGDYIQIYARSQEAGTTTINDSTDWIISVLEWDNLEDIFVQDVRYQDGVLQKQIGGIWFDVVDLDAIIDPIASAAAAANAAAAAAQTTANNAVSVNNAQQTTINNHTTRLNNAESDIDDLQLSVSQINAIIVDHESRIDALEAAGHGWAGTGLGKVEHDDLSAVNGYTSSTNVFQTSSPRGWIPDLSGTVEVFCNNAMRFGSAVIVRARVMNLGADTELLYLSVNDGPQTQLMLPSANSGSSYFTWLVVNPYPIPTALESMKIKVHSPTGSGTWLLNGMIYLCVNINPFDETLFP